MSTTQVNVLRRQPSSAGANAAPVHVTHLAVDMPRGAEEHGDVVRRAVKEAVAKHAGIRVPQVSLSHREASEGGGYIAYIPQLQETR